PPITFVRQFALPQMYSTAENASRRFAWAHDDLQPESLSYKDSRHGWGASIVDSISTVVRFSTVILSRCRHLCERSKTSVTVSVCETTIRYMAGMLSVYELCGER
ncbi:hypothetical protein BDZ89DRAFT_931377, partial [Hymenopellis radicata]